MKELAAAHTQLKLIQPKRYRIDVQRCLLRLLFNLSFNLLLLPNLNTGLFHFKTEAEAVSEEKKILFISTPFV